MWTVAWEAPSLRNRTAVVTDEATAIEVSEALLLKGAQDVKYYEDNQGDQCREGHA